MVNIHESLGDKLHRPRGGGVTEYLEGKDHTYSSKRLIRAVTLKHLLQQVLISLDYKIKLMIDFINSQNSVIRNCHVCIKMHEKENYFQHPVGKNSSTALYSLSDSPVTISHPYVYPSKVKDIKLQRASKSKGGANQKKRTRANYSCRECYELYFERIINSTPPGHVGDCFAI